MVADRDRVRASGARRRTTADAASADAAFATARAMDLERWPLARARLSLAYGTWLRRQRRVAESRVELRTARDLLDAIGVRYLADRAQQELGASGEATRHRGIDVLDQLTPQELQIARLAAEGSRIARSGRASTSVIGRSARTCTGCSRSSASPPAPSCIPRCADAPTRSDLSHRSRRAAQQIQSSDRSAAAALAVACTAEAVGPEGSPGRKRCDFRDGPCETTPVDCPASMTLKVHKEEPRMFTALAAQNWAMFVLRGIFALALGVLAFAAPGRRSRR